MELKTFIKNTLTEIALGIREANQELSTDKNGTVELFKLRRNVGNNDAATNIEFNVELAVQKDQKDKAGFFVAVASIGGGASTEKGSEKQITQRIVFEVNVADNWH